MPGWTATVTGQKMVDGEMEGGNSITWKGKLSGTELAVLPFTGVPKKAQDYAFTVRQTYSDGSVVMWSGDESSDTPAAHVTASAEESSSSSSSDSSKTIAIVALIVGGLGLLIGGAALVAGRREA